MDVSMDTVSVQIETVVNESNKAIDSLIGKLNTLQDALKNVVKASASLSQLSKSMNNINNKTTSSFANKKSQVSGQSKNSSLQSQLSTLGVSLNSKEMISSVKSVNNETTKYKNNLGQVITVQKKMKNGMDDYKVTVKETANQMGNFEKFKNSIAGTVTKIGLLWGTMTKVKNSMMEYVDLSASYVESLNLFFTEMGSKAEEAYEWVQMFSNALYLDPADVMQYMGAFNSLVSGLGVGADRSYLMSKNLTQLTYDLASYKNLDFSTAYEKLMSGISGEIEPLRNTGVALSQATLQELANELGIKKRINAMNEAEKAELRYIQIIRSSTNWQADLGKTLTSTENIMKVAGQQWALFKRAVGDVATVIVRFALPYLIALTQILTEGARALANFFGFEIDFSKFKTGSKDTSKGIAKIGDEADTATKKLNTMLAPFDELNVVQNKNESASSGLGGIGGGLGVDLPEYDALSKLTSEWSDKIKDARKELESFLPIIKAVAIGLASVFAINKVANFVESLKTLIPFKLGKKSAGKDVDSKSSFKLPTWKHLLKGMGQLATLITGAILFVEAIGLLTRIPGFKENITTGVDALVDVFTGVLKISVPLALLAGGSALIGNLPYKTILQGFGGIATIIGGTTALMSVIGLILGNEYFKQFNTSGVELLKNTFNGLGEVFVPLVAMSGIIVGLGAVMSATGATGFAVIGLGLLALAEIITGTGAVLAVAGALYDIPNVDKFVESGVELLTKIGEAIGGFVGGLAGGIVGGVIEGLSSSLPALGSNLSLFMTNAKDFFEGINSVDKNATEGVKNLAQCMLLLTANDILEGLTGWFTGNTSLESFGEELKLFAPKFKDFANEISGIKDSDLKKAPKVAEALATMIDVSKDIPNQGKSVVSFFVGDNTLSTFGNELKLFAPKFVEYMNKISTIDDNGLNISEKVFKALSNMIDVSKNIPNQGKSVVSFFVGDNTLSTFGEELALFAPDFKSYYDDIKGIGNDVEDKTDQVFSAVERINDVTIDKKGGLFSGEMDLSDFADDLKDFGTKFKSYNDTIKNVDINKINTVTDALLSLVSTYKTIKDGKLSDTVTSFGTALKNSAGNIKSYFSTQLGYQPGWTIGNSFGSGIGDAIKSAIKSKLGTKIEVKDGYNTLKTFSISAYANGGYPDKASLFFANENGIPELVGRIGNQTAVANNDQITTALTSALLTALSGADLGGQGTIVVNIGNKKVYEGMGEHIDSESERYGTSYVNL